MKSLFLEVKRCFHIYKIHLIAKNGIKNDTILTLLDHRDIVSRIRKLQYHRWPAFFINTSAHIYTQVRVYILRSIQQKCTQSTCYILNVGGHHFRQNTAVTRLFYCTRYQEQGFGRMYRDVLMAS